VRQPAAARIEPASGAFDELLEQCDVLVSSASSVCMQALACGVPVIVLGNTRGITLNPIPEAVDREIWKLCYTPDELTAALREYERRDAASIERRRRLGAEIRARYFSPVTPEAVAALLEPAGVPAATANAKAC
jgi:glycosyltransferase involved in cell wall biosynthesis